MKWKNELFFVRYSVAIHCLSWKLWANFNLNSSYTEHGIIIFIILLFLLSWILLYKPPPRINIETEYVLLNFLFEIKLDVEAWLPPHLNDVLK